MKKKNSFKWKGLLSIGIWMVSIAMFAQNITVRGTVTDANNEPVIGASIVVEGNPSLGTITDIDGRYLLSNVPADATLQFSYVGMITQSIPVNGKTTIDLIMESDDEVLDEVVVVGYGTQKKVNLTGAISALNKEELISKPSGQLSATLQGMAPGVTITTSTGQPGLNTGTIRIRGLGTLNNNEPLVLIDGLEGDINDVDANDVTSMSILKDAAASSIYGIRAANGVILITTKRGEENRTKISYSNYFGWQDPSGVSKFLGAQNFMKLANMTYGTAIYSDAQIKAYDDPNRNADKYPDTYLLGDLMDTGSGFQQQHSLSFSGGNNRLKYALSANYFEQQGVIENMDFQRLTVRLNTDAQISDRFRLNADLSARLQDRSEPATAWDLINNLAVANPLSISQYSDGSWGIIRGSSNPLRIAKEGGDHSYKSDLFTGNFKGVYTLAEGLTVTGLVGVRMDYMNNSIQDYALTYNKQFPSNGETTTFGRNQLTKQSNKYYQGNYQGLVNYNKTFGSHDIALLGGVSYLREQQDDLEAYRYGIPAGLTEIDAGSEDSQTNGGTAWQYGLMSYFGRFNYSYEGKYLFEANVRRDGSSRFAKDQRWGIFPSFSAGWRISEETFLKDVAFLNNLKLRASWGQLGNDQTINSSGSLTYYPYQTQYSAYSYPFGGSLQSAMGLRVYPNSNLTWETTEMTDVGFDATILSGKLDVVFDYYVKNTKDILLSLPIPYSVGLSAPVQNAAKVRNNGWELALNYRDKIGSDFNYSVGFNLSDVKNEVVDLKGTDQISVNNNNIATGLIVGKPINSFYGYEVLGMYKTQEDLTAYQKFSNNVTLGDLIYKKNVEGAYGFDDMVYLGSNIPRYTYGINLAASYKNIDFSAFLQGVGKVNINTVVMERAPVNTDGNFKEIHLDSWTEANPNASFPRLSSGNQNYQSSSFWVKSGAYLRLKNVQLGYTLPDSFVNRLSIAKCRFYVTGSNLLTFTKLPNDIDPEAPNENRYYPQVKTYTFGVNIEF
ncbi:MAG TPA: SusC/RagA family TonB-linked outer membrane protein [Porphyromonadaceae bacterium]|nr:SusC/RagA family TonB-linked outer membrane protein [Porphyromonadaceae bacterium]